MNRSKYFFLCFLILLSAFANNASAQLTQYNIGTAGNELASRVCYLPSDGSSIIAGYTYDLTAGSPTNCQAFLMKITSAGTIAWQKKFGIAGKDNLVHAMIITSDNNIVIAGTVGRTSLYAGNNAALIKFSSTDGSLIWQSNLHTNPANTGGEVFLGVTELGDGRLVAVGATQYDALAGAANSLICVFQSDGTFLYNDVYITANNDNFSSVTTSADGLSIYTCGIFVGDYQDMSVIKYTPGTSSGTVNWAKYFDFYIFGTLQNNFPIDIFLSGSRLVIGGCALHNYTTTGGEGGFTITINASDGGTPQLHGIQTGGLPYSNSCKNVVISPDHIITIQSPASSFFDVFSASSVLSTNTVITEITSLNSKTYNSPVKFASAEAGAHTINDMRLNGTQLYMAGCTNVASGYGNNDIYFVTTTTNFHSSNNSCDTAHDVIVIKDTTVIAATPSVTHTTFAPAYTTVAVSDATFGIHILCGDVPADTVCNSVILADTIKSCYGTLDTLDATIIGADSILNITWSPATGVSSTTVLDPTVTATTSRWYYLTVNSIIPYNLVNNGDFTAGNTGFTSSYIYSAPPSTTLAEGNYSVYTNPNGVHTGFTSFGDHTTGTGNMMILNGASTPVDVWCETVTVTPNTDYDFSAWFANCSSVTVGADVPTLQFKINGVLQGVPTTVSSLPGVWVNFFTTWNSGPSTSATICIYDANTTPAGNDFVIDDIKFQRLCKVQDSIYLSVKTPDTTYTHKDTTVCATTAGVTLTSPAATSYLWSTGATTASITVTSSGNYRVYATSNCATLIDTFKVTFKPLPVVNLGIDTGFCIGDSIILTSLQPAGDTLLWSNGTSGNNIHVLTAGTYWLQVSNGCKATDSIHIVSSPHPVVNLGPDTVICFGNSLTLLSYGTYTSPVYLWNNGSVAPSVVANTSGTYWLQVTDGGCPGADTIRITLLYDTMRIHTPDTAICRGASVQVLATGNPLITYQWIPTAGIPISTISSPLITPDTSVLYILKGSLPGCPDVLDSIFIDVQPTPSVYTGSNRQLCQFDSLHIVPSVLPAWYSHYSYTWSPAANLDNTTLSAAIYTATDTFNHTIVLTVKTPAGCIGIDSVTLILHPGNFARLDSDVAICPHDSVQFNPMGGVSYVWHPAMYLSDSTAARPWIHAITNQHYSVIATSQFNCKDTLGVNVTVHPAAIINIGDSARIFPGESYQLAPLTNCSDFLWSPPAGLSNRYISNPVATPEINTKYILQGITEWNCKTKDSINIYVDEGAVIDVPNAFSPGSGVNNYFTVIKRGLATLSYLRIFNRWGNLVYESKNIDAGWDGKYNGVPQPFGVFVYELEAVTNKGVVIHKRGNITLIR